MAKKTVVAGDTAKGKPGRPRKEEGDRLEQFSIRLTPKLKFGLEMLARAQNRSLSQAVEWALQVGLNSFRVNNDWEPVATILDRAWAKESDFDRYFAIYLAAPNLLTFEDRSACEWVERSMEYEAANDTFEIRTRAEKRGDPQAWEKWHEQRLEIFWAFARATWPLIRARSIERSNAGRLPEGSLISDLNLMGSVGADPFARMKAVAEYINGTMAGDRNFAIRTIELDTELPWSLNLGKWSKQEIEQVAKTYSESSDNEVVRSES